jgi:hypothetical protein
MRGVGMHAATAGIDGVTNVLFQHQTIIIVTFILGTVRGDAKSQPFVSLMLRGAVAERGVSACVGSVSSASTRDATAAAANSATAGALRTGVQAFGVIVSKFPELVAPGLKLIAEELARNATKSTA